MKTYVYPKPNTENITYGDRKKKHIHSHQQTYTGNTIKPICVIGKHREPKCPSTKEWISVVCQKESQDSETVTFTVTI